VLDGEYLYDRSNVDRYLNSSDLPRIDAGTNLARSCIDTLTHSSIRENTGIIDEAWPLGITFGDAR
jgi:hypothetical protein